MLSATDILARPLFARYGWPARGSFDFASYEGCACAIAPRSNRRTRSGCAVSALHAANALMQLSAPTWKNGAGAQAEMQGRQNGHG